MARSSSGVQEFGTYAMGFPRNLGGLLNSLRDKVPVAEKKSTGKVKQDSDSFVVSQKPGNQGPKGLGGEKG